MFWRGMVVTLVLVATINLDAKRKVTLVIQKNNDQEYGFSLIPKDPNFFTVPQGFSDASEKSPFLKKFFINIDDKSAFTFNSQQNYDQLIDDLKKNTTEAQELAKSLIRRQGLAAQMNQYFFGGDIVTKVQSLLRAALKKLKKTISNTYIKTFTKLDIEITIDLDDKATILPFFSQLYNAIKDFGEVIGFDMPPLEPWYVRHRGKLIVGTAAVTGLALFAIARSANLFGTATPAIAPRATTGQQPVMTSPKELTLFESLKGRAYKWGEGFAQRQAGEVGKRIVESLGRESGQKGNPLDPYEHAADLVLEQINVKRGLMPPITNPTPAQQAAAAGAKAFYESQGEAWRKWTPK